MTGCWGYDQWGRGMESTPDLGPRQQDCPTQHGEQPLTFLSSRCKRAGAVPLEPCDSVGGGSGDLATGELPAGLLLKLARYTIL